MARAVRNRHEAVHCAVAAQHGRSAEREAPGALRGNLAASIRARFARSGGVELPTIARDPMREPPSFDGTDVVSDTEN
jgi:plasmid stability protein